MIMNKSRNFIFRMNCTTIGGIIRLRSYLAELKLVVNAWIIIFLVMVDDRLMSGVSIGFFGCH